MTAVYQNNELTDDQELLLNPAPKKYKVSFAVKIIFLLMAALGVVFYAYMIIERRITQHTFLVHNQLEAVKLVPTTLPRFQVMDLVNKTVLDINEQFTTWTLLNVWATWCPSCNAEMPSLELLQRQFKEKLNIIALSVDEKSDVVKQFIETHNPSFRVLWDKDQKSILHLGIKKYPETFLISPDGMVITQFSGPRDWSSKVAVDYFSNLIKQVR